MPEHTYPRFSDAEYARRHAQVRERMDRANLSALVLCGFGRSSEIDYLANWRTTTEAWLIFPREGDSTLLVQLSNHLPNARLMSIVDDVRHGGASATGGPDSVPTLVASLKDRGLVRGRVGLVGPVPFQHYGRINDARPDLELVDFSGQMRDQRQIKILEEIEALRVSAALCDLSVAALAEQVRPGITEHNLDRIVENAYLGEGGINQIHFMITTSMHAPEGGVPRQYMSDRVLRQGDMLATEISANRFGYTAQILRTFTIGEEPTEEYRRMHDVAMEAFARVEAVLRPGATVAEVMDAAEIVNESGYAVYDDFLHGREPAPAHHPHPTDVQGRAAQLHVQRGPVLRDPAHRGVGRCLPRRAVRRNDAHHRHRGRAAAQLSARADRRFVGQRPLAARDTAPGQCGPHDHRSSKPIWRSG